MRLWRVSRHRDLTGAGGLFVAGRWHSLGKPVVYTSEHPGTAQLEWLARLDVSLSTDSPPTIPFSEIVVDDGVTREEIHGKALPAGWESNEAVTQAIGDRWLASRRSLLLFVPSALVPARNVLINPLHEDSKRMRLASVFDFRFDPRLT